MGTGPGRRRGKRDQHAAGLSPDQALDTLYKSHYRPMTQLATLLANGDPAAEEIVQDAFVAMHDGWPALGGDEQAVLYLLRTIVRHFRTRHAGRGSAGPGTVPGPQSMLLRALHSLPPAQREAVLLSCVANLPEARVADVMGIKGRAAREYLACGLRSLASAEPDLPGLPGAPG